MVEAKTQHTSVNDLFTKKTRSIVYGRQFVACQGMLDFDYVCTREQPSVACIVDPFNETPRKDFYWGSKQVFIPSNDSLKWIKGLKAAMFLVNK